MTDYFTESYSEHEEEEETYEDRLCSNAYTREMVNEAILDISRTHRVGEMFQAIDLLKDALDDTYFDELESHLDYCINLEFGVGCENCEKNIILKYLYYIYYDLTMPGIPEDIAERIHDCSQCNGRTAWLFVNVIDEIEPELIGVCKQCHNYVAPDQ